MNTLVQVRKVGDHYMTVTGTTAGNEFDPLTLDTLQAPFQFNDTMFRTFGGFAPGPSHAHFLPDGTMVHYVWNFWPGSSSYNFYTVAPGSTTRVPLGKVPANKAYKGWPAYQHSFSVTNHYAVVVEQSVTFPFVGAADLERPAGGDMPPRPPQAVLEDVSGNGSLWDDFKFHSDVPSQFLVLDLSSGEHVATIQAPAFVTFHTVNAYERVTAEGDTEIVLDVIVYKSLESLYLGTLENYIHNPFALDRADAIPYTVRYVLPVSQAAGNATNIITIDPIIGKDWVGAELPTIYYDRFNGQPYRFSYSVGEYTTWAPLYNAIVKADVGEDDASFATPVLTKWHPSGCANETACFVGEPIFVPSPAASSEDDGVLLSVVLDAGRNSSFLAFVDASTMEQVGSAHLPDGMYIPNGFHGRFYPPATGRATH
jgi:torulene dioxygenase